MVAFDYLLLFVEKYIDSEILVFSCPNPVVVGVLQVVCLISAVEKHVASLVFVFFLSKLTAATVDVFGLLFLTGSDNLSRESHGMFVRHHTMNAESVREHLGSRSVMTPTQYWCC